MWFIVRRWVWDANMLGALVGDEMELGKTFTVVAVAMIPKLQTEKVVMQLPQLILWGNPNAEWVNVVQNDISGIIGEQRDWYPVRRHNSVLHHLIEIPKTPPQGHPALTSALEPILAVTMLAVAETLKSVIDEMTFGTHLKLINLVPAENPNLTHEDLNTSPDEPDNRFNILLVSYDTLTSRAKPSSNGQLSNCSWSFGIFAEFHRYKMKNSVGWRIAMNARIALKLQVTAMPAFHSLYDWCFQTMWLFSGASEDPDDNTVMEMHRTYAQ